MKHDPVSPEYLALLNATAEALDKIFNNGLKGDERQVAFILILTPFGEKPDARLNYISNANRQDAIAALKEFIARNEGRYHESGGQA